MKLLQVNSTVNRGSTGRIVEDIGRLAIARGHHSYIAYGRGNSLSSSETIRIGNSRDNFWHWVNTILFDTHGFASTRATNELVNYLSVTMPDIIGLHNLHGYYLNIEVLFNFLSTLKIPIVWTLHDCWAFTGHCVHYENIGCNKWETQCFKCPKKIKYPSSRFLDNSKNNYIKKKILFNKPNNLTLVVPSLWLKNELSRSFLKDIPCIVINNGVDLDIFKPKKDKILREEFVGKKIILGVANVWQKSKGWDDFIELAKILDNRIYQIVLVGVKESQKKKLPDSIYSISKTANIEELAIWYSNADIFINPTYADNFPTTNLEALACGTPVVTYNTGGSPESIDENTGLVVEKGDIIGLRKAIETISMLDQEKLRANCRQRAIENYDKNMRFNDYVSLYEGLIKNLALKST
jgi:putative colanic acid biosynthesis glycosyltransferase